MNWKFQQIQPTPARGTFKVEYYEDPAWSAERKYDGDRRIAQFCEDGVRFTGRHISSASGLLVEKSANLPQLNEAVPELIGTVLDGEMVHPAPGSRSNAVTSVMGSSPERAAQLQAREGFLWYKVFDCLFYKGKDLRGEPLDERRLWLSRAVQEWENKYAHQAQVAREHKLAFLHKIWAEGGEGVILKRNDSLYMSQNLWVKVKREFTADVVIMGYAEPDAESVKVNGQVSVTKFKERGWIGAVIGGQYKDGELTEVARVSGMKDTLREDFSKTTNKSLYGNQKYVGMVMEIQANEREPSGRFRHPRFSRLRPDKNLGDCIFNLNEK